MNLYLPEGIILLHNTFVEDGIPHAFGGAIALAYSGKPRATTDIDINVFLTQDQRRRVLDSVSRLFRIVDRETAERELEHSAQTRVRWDTTPVDLFFSNSAFHDAMARRARPVDYVGTTIPVLSSEDLIICKAAFNRPRDWADIEDIFKIQGSQLDGAYLTRWLDEFYEPQDEPVQRIDAFLRAYGRGGGPEPSR